MVQYGRTSLADCIQRLRRRTPQKIIHKIMVKIVWIFLFFFFFNIVLLFVGLLAYACPFFSFPTQLYIIESCRAHDYAPR